MLKKMMYASFLFAVALGLVLPSNFAMAKSDSTSNNGDLSPDTKVTKDNINKVVKHYGIDPSNVTKYKKPQKDGKSMTVEEFGKKLKQIKKQPKERTIKKSLKKPEASEKAPNETKPNATTQAAGTKTVSHTTHFKPYNVTYTQTGHYSGKHWTSSGASSASVSSKSPGVVYQINKKSFTSNVKNNTLHQKANLKLGRYIGIKKVKVKVGTTKIHGDTSWGKKYL